MRFVHPPPQTTLLSAAKKRKIKYINIKSLVYSVEIQTHEAQKVELSSLELQHILLHLLVHQSYPASNTACPCHPPTAFGRCPPLGGCPQCDE